MLIDAHCHLANLNVLRPVEPLLDEARGRGIGLWLSSALSKQEVAWHLSHLRPDLPFSAGIHPNFDECDLELTDIVELCMRQSIWAVGEIGLDRNNPDLDWQLAMLTAQLDLAAEHRMPVVLHLIGYQQQAYEILRQYPLKYLVHSYAGSYEGFELLCRLDSCFTVSERILRPDKLRLLKGIVARGAFLFETDLTRYYTDLKEPNPLLRLLDLFRLTQGLLGIGKEALLERQNCSYAEFVGGKR